MLYFSYCTSADNIIVNYMFKNDISSHDYFFHRRSHLIGQAATILLSTAFLRNVSPF